MGKIYLLWYVGWVAEGRDEESGRPVRALLRYFWCQGLRTGTGVMAVEMQREAELQKY